MIQDHRPLARLLLAATLLGAVGGGPLARAQDLIEDAEEEAPQAQQVFVMGDDQFEFWVFGNGRNATSARGRLESLLALQIEYLDRTCGGVTDEQKKKLRLAGRGDVKRFFDRVEEKRKRFNLVKNDQNKVGEIYQELQPLQLAMNTGPFGEGSFFAKTLRKTLSAEQVAHYEKEAREKALYRYRARVDMAVATLGNALGLSRDQRRRFTGVILEETRPPRSLGRHEYHVIMLRASKLPEARIRPIFDDAQWRLLRQQFAQVKGAERVLKDGGYVPDDGDESDPATAKPEKEGAR